MLSNSNVRVVGVDIGFGDVKVVSDYFKNEAGDMLISFPSYVASATEETFSIKGKPVQPIKVNGKKYLVGEDARSERIFDMRFKEWINEDAYMALFLKALSFIHPGTLSIVTGLPVSEYKSCKDILKKRMAGEFTIAGGVYSVVDVKVMPQPFGSFFNYALDSNGRQADNNALKETVGVVDIGYRTSDYILIEECNFKEDTSGTIEDLGVSNLVEKLQTRISEKFNIKLSVAKVRSALKTKEIRAFSQAQNIEPLIDEEAKILSEVIVKKAKTYWQSGGHIDTLLLIGGGAAIFKPYIEKGFQHAISPKAPSFSNALGYWKYGLGNR